MLMVSSSNGENPSYTYWFSMCSKWMSKNFFIGSRGDKMQVISLEHSSVLEMKFHLHVIPSAASSS